MPTKEERNSVAEKIITCLPDIDDFVFGGYIRDRISDKNFKDIDVCTFSISQFIDKLKDAGFVIHSNKPGKYKTNLKHRKISVSFKGSDGWVRGIDIDAIELFDRRTAFASKVVSEEKFDADINLFYRKKDKATIFHFLYPKGSSEYEEAIANAKNCRFKALSTCEEWRKEKLSLYGYDQIIYAGTSEHTHVNASIPNLNVSETTLANKNQNCTTEKFNEENNMSNTSKNATSPMAWFAARAQEGAIQGMAASAVNLVRQGILTAMKKSGKDDFTIGVIAGFLESEMGFVLLSAAIGSAVHFMPVDTVQSNNKIQKVADKCMENATAKGIEQLTDLAMNFVMPALMSAVEGKASPFAQEDQKNVRVQLEDSPVNVEHSLPSHDVDLSDLDGQNNVRQFVRAAKSLDLKLVS